MSVHQFHSHKYQTPQSVFQDGWNQGTWWVSANAQSCDISEDCFHRTSLICSRTYRCPVQSTSFLGYWKTPTSHAQLAECNPKKILRRAIPQYHCIFTISDSISLSYQRTFHLSLAVLVRYRTSVIYLALEEFYLPYSHCNIKQCYSQTPVPSIPWWQKLDYHHLGFSKEILLFEQKDCTTIKVSGTGSYSTPLIMLVTKLSDSELGYSPFIRHYSGNPS